MTVQAVPADIGAACFIMRQSRRTFLQKELAIRLFLCKIEGAVSIMYKGQDEDRIHEDRHF